MSLPKARLARMVLKVLVVVALGTLLTQAATEVWHGNGAGVYQNVYGMQIHWVSVLSLAAAFLVAFLVALALRWWQHRDDRTIDRLLCRRRNGGS
jgi:ABC-type sulfate transport system permease component